MRLVFQYIRPKLMSMSFQLTVKFAGTIVELLLPWMLSRILDVYVPAGDVPMIWTWGGLMILCAALALLCNVAANRMATAISRDITEALRQDLFAKITRLSSAQRDAFTTPSLISRLTTDTYNVHQMVDRMQRLGVRAPILLLGGILIALILEPVLTLVLAAMLPLLGLLVFTVSRRGVGLYTRAQTALDALVRQAKESMAGIRVIQALSKGDYERSRFDEAKPGSDQAGAEGGASDECHEPGDESAAEHGLDAGRGGGGFPGQCRDHKARDHHRLSELFYHHPQCPDDGVPPVCHVL